MPDAENESAQTQPWKRGRAESSPPSSRMSVRQGRDPSRHFLNPEEAADVLRMDSRTLVRWARLGYVPAHPLGEGKRRLWRFIEAELICWLEERGTPFKKPGANTIETAINAHARRTA